MTVGWHSRGYLPHLDAPDIVQSVTFRLADSLPQNVLRALRSRRVASQELRRNVEKLLDCGYGSCALRIPEIAGLVEHALLHFDRERYRVLAWSIMPNHVHAVLRVNDGHTLSSIVHSWKSYTAKRAREFSPGEGRFWQPDYFDRYVRDDEHLAATISYVEYNPVRAGLCAEPEDWPFSSARCRGGPRSERPAP
ncbi:putative transposase [Constrictibacter sp. MBR-5]|jgi:REP element-mobilizing transposase RayT|uniref:REP-associated tyrosine transposase n=1 Tax=Constrictibacter sp. MBR-5 TaxID=3156467 RepID=UPI0033981CEB